MQNVDSGFPNAFPRSLSPAAATEITREKGRDDAQTSRQVIKRLTRRCVRDAALALPRAACVALALCLGATSSNAALLGAEGFTVPPLACFGTAPVETYDMSSVASDLSGVTYDPETDTFFVVNNGDAIAYEIQLPDTLLGRWNLKVGTFEKFQSSRQLPVSPVSVKMAKKQCTCWDNNPFYLSPQSKPTHYALLKLLMRPRRFMSSGVR